jgi:putative transposase
MPRQARIVIPHIPHHVTQRGNYRQDVFDEEGDYGLYCTWMGQYAEKYGLDILAYCLMSNHVHFIVVPRQEESLARVFNTLHMRYAQHVNRRNAARGHVWQGRFFSCFMDTGHLYHAMRYVERNPVRMGLVQQAWHYRWSSARVHAGQAGGRGPLAVNTRKFAMDSKQWKEYLQVEDEPVVEELRLKTQRGLVLGSSGFVKRLEQKLERSLACLNPGRPKKEKR